MSISEDSLCILQSTRPSSEVCTLNHLLPFDFKRVYFSKLIFHLEFITIVFESSLVSIVDLYFHVVIYKLVTPNALVLGWILKLMVVLLSHLKKC